MDSGELVEDLTPLFDLVDFEKRFFRFMDSNELADCEFVVGPQKTVIKGHKVFFCAASEVFDAMFLGDLKETKPVHVEDLEPDGFQAMKKYIYTGQTDFESVFHALNTYIAARKYLIESLKRECIAYIDEKLQPSQVLEFLDRCILDCISLFNDHCSKIISDKTADVVNSQYFSSANFETIELILKAPSLKLKSELELFGHFERWALAEAERQGISEEDIATSFNSLKKHIRFLTISGKDFVTHIEPSPLLTREEKRVIALNKIKFNPNLTSENISMVQKLRGLDMPQFYIRYEEKHIFKIPVNNTSIGRRISTSINLLPASTENRSYNGSYHSVDIFWTNHNTSIYFEADTRFYRISMKKIVIKSKFRVIGKYVHDDLHFKRQCEFSVINNDNYNPKLNSYMLEIIPKSSLKPAHYSNTNVVSIEGMFSVEKIDL